MTPPFQVKTIGQSSGGTPLVTSNSPTGLAPATVGAVYNLNTGLTSPTSAIGAGQVIAIVDAYHDPNALNDLNAFNAKYGYPALATCSAAPPFTATTGACFYQADPEGTPSSTGSIAAGWILEESLDIEWAHAEAPGATRSHHRGCRGGVAQHLRPHERGQLGERQPRHRGVDQLGRQRVERRDQLRLVFRRRQHQHRCAHPLHRLRR
jgi:hypothetical protein